MTPGDSRYADAMEYWGKNPVEAIKDWFKVTPEDYQAVLTVLIERIEGRKAQFRGLPLQCGRAACDGAGHVGKYHVRWSGCA